MLAKVACLPPTSYSRIWESTKKGDKSSEKTARFVIWICSKFTREEIEQIIQGLLDVLVNRNPDVKPKDDFKEKHPNYRNFFVDANPPLKTPPKTRPKLD